jgi:transcriptional regulator with PAS, ATPase and Fis domain
MQHLSVMLSCNLAPKCNQEGYKHQEPQRVLFCHNDEFVMEDETYQVAAKENFIQAFDKLMNVVQESGDVIMSNDTTTTTQQSHSATATNATATELTDAERKEAAEKQVMEDLAAMCPTNIKEPNFGRWGTISYVAKIVLHHWLPLFYMAQNVRDTEKNGCYLHVIATKLVELMSSKADPKQQTPTHYASFQWIVGLGRQCLMVTWNGLREMIPSLEMEATDTLRDSCPSIST